MEAKENKPEETEIVPLELYSQLQDALHKQKYWGSVVTDYNNGQITHVKLTQGFKKRGMEQFIGILTRDSK